MGQTCGTCTGMDDKFNATCYDANWCGSKARGGAGIQDYDENNI